MKDFNNVLIIIPTYNEIDNIELMITQIFHLFPSINLLIVDDNSPDGTSKIVKQQQKNFDDKLFLMERNQSQRGLAKSYIEGMTWALKKNYDYFIQMDCDFSHDPKELTTLIEASNENDMVTGSRYLDGIRILNWPMSRLLLSYLASIYIRLITGLPIKDATSGFKCLNRHALTSINLSSIMSEGYIFQLELIYRAYSQGLKIKEVPITFSQRREGESKISGGIILEGLMTVLRLKFLNLSGRLVNKKESGEKKAGD